MTSRTNNPCLAFWRYLLNGFSELCAVAKKDYKPNPQGFWQRNFKLLSYGHHFIALELQFGQANFVFGSEDVLDDG